MRLFVAALGIVAHLNDEHPAVLVKANCNRINHQRLGRHQLDMESVAHLKRVHRVRRFGRRDGVFGVPPTEPRPAGPIPPARRWYNQVERPRRRVRNPAIITLTGFAVLIVSAKFGTAAMFLVGIPAVLVASAVAGGARSPTKIPLRDAILYVGISVAIVVGIVVYAMYHH